MDNVLILVETHAIYNIHIYAYNVLYCTHTGITYICCMYTHPLYFPLMLIISIKESISL